MTMLLSQLHELARRFVPSAAVDRRFHDAGARSWWPAHEIGHFLVATAEECQRALFDLDDDFPSLYGTPRFRYVISREVAATSISQRLLRGNGHVALADDELAYTDEQTLECSHEPWCKRVVRGLLRKSHSTRLPRSAPRLELLLAKKARWTGTPVLPRRKPRSC